MAKKVILTQTEAAAYPRWPFVVLKRKIMAKRSLQMWLSSDANTIVDAMLEQANTGKSKRRGDKMLTKAELCSQMLDDCLGVEGDEDGK